MIHDLQNQFSSAQAITASAASTNYIDLGLNRNVGVGEALYVGFVVTTAFTDSGSDSTVTVSLETDDNTSFSSPATAQTVGTFAALSAAGSRLVVRLQVDKIVERYLQARYAVTNGNLTTGAITSFLTHDIDAFNAYANGFVVS